MSMDGLSLAAVTRELQKLVSGKIDKVQQPEKDMLLFTVRAGGETMRLLFCAHAENGRVQLTQKTYENPDVAPAFCMLLRRRLQGGRISAVRQEKQLERVLYLEIAAHDELLDDVTLTFAFELTGKHTNILLLDGAGSIIDCTRHISAGETTTRIMLPGFPYDPVPLQNKRSLLDADRAELLAMYQEADPARVLCEGYGGLSRQSANALAAAYPTVDLLMGALADFNRGLYSPSQSSTGVLPFQPSGEYVSYPTMSEAYDAYYAIRDRNARMQRHSAGLRRVCEQALKRARNRQRVFFDALHNEAQSERYRNYGEWILANLSLVRAGEPQITVDNYYTDPPTKESVPLDVKLSAVDNAQKYFKLYKKSKTARAYAEEQMTLVNAEIEYLEGQLQNIGNADTIAELEEIRDELIREHYVRPDKKTAKKLNRTASAPLQFRSSEGLVIRVGKNNRQNDALTLKEAKPDDMFLHAKNIPGSHVILECAGSAPERSLMEAAMLAAYYSGARGSSSVPVDYTPRRYVKKPSGARPGFVVYSTNRTLYVTPDPLLADKLKV